MIKLSTAYFPSIYWMALAYQNEEIQIDLLETYPKQTYRNRCHIATANGMMTLSAAVKKPSGNRSKTSEIVLDYTQNWPLIHWRSIQAAYQSSAFFLYYQDEIEALFATTYTSLSEMNETILLSLSQLIGFSPKIVYAEEFISPNVQEQDYRFAIHPKTEAPIQFPSYHQVFEDKTAFLPNMSALDLLFNMGPESISYLDDLVLPTQ